MKTQTILAPRINASMGFVPIRIIPMLAMMELIAPRMINVRMAFAKELTSEHVTLQVKRSVPSTNLIV